MDVGRSIIGYLVVAGCLSLVPSLPVFAQRPGGGGPPPGGGMPSGGGMPGGGSMAGGSIPGGSPREIEGPGDARNTLPSGASVQQSGGPMRGGVQFGPPNRWWDDKHYAKTLHLRADQKKRMDGLFDENRANLVNRYETLQQEESKMETLSHAQTLDEAALFAQIDRVAQARADLEKATTHLMLQVRKEMDADQITRLDASR
jgi:Spy/CpxP family protein refolding chaperone